RGVGSGIGRYPGRYRGTRHRRDWQRREASARRGRQIVTSPTSSPGVAGAEVLRYSEAPAKRQGVAWRTGASEYRSTSAPATPFHRVIHTGWRSPEVSVLLFSASSPPSPRRCTT